MDIQSYKRIIIAFSGGKDSLACVLNLIKQGISRDKIELWHYEVDGREGSTLMDWSITPDYCRKVAEVLGIKIYFAWKVGGFQREMLRQDALTAPTSFETPEGIKTKGGLRGKENTRMKWPQVCADLSSRWCSAYLKIDVAAISLRNQKRFYLNRTLFITGERAEESPGRAKYKVFEIHKCDTRNGKNKRHLDHWRPVHAWSEAQIWDIIREFNVNPHPAYRLGWGRVSCAACIFGSKNQWASLHMIDPEKIKVLSNYESLFNRNINRKQSVAEMVVEGEPYKTMDESTIKEAMAVEFTAPVIVDNWTLPAGAFAESCGPV